MTQPMAHATPNPCPGAQHAFPRVLVISHNSFSTSHNNGRTLANLFADWPPDRLAQIFLHPLLSDSKVCQRYWLVTELDQVKSFFRWGYQPGGPPAMAEPAAAERSALTRPPEYVYTRLRNLHSATLDWLREGIWMRRRWDTPALRQWIADFRPDVVFFMGGGGLFAYDMASTIVSDYRLPSVIYFTDDFLAPVGGLLARWHRRALMRRQRAVLARADTRLVVGEVMAREYHAHYGGERFLAFMNCVDASAFPYHPPRGTTGTVRLAYLGGLHLDRWRALLEIGEALMALAQKGVHGELAIYSRPQHLDQYAQAFAKTPSIRLSGSVGAGDLAAVMTAADILVHVESFEHALRAYTRLALSTKIPEYLMVGRPVLAYGPPEGGSVRYLTENEVGVTVGVHDREALQEGLRTLLTDAPLRENCGRRARQVALARHDAQAEREKFNALFDRYGNQA